MSTTPSRNESCSCGSGKKYKKCCGIAPKKLQQRVVNHTQQPQVTGMLRLLKESTQTASTTPSFQSIANRITKK